MVFLPMAALYVGEAENGVDYPAFFAGQRAYRNTPWRASGLPFETAACAASSR